MALPIFRPMIYQQERSASIHDYLRYQLQQEHRERMRTIPHAHAWVPVPYVDPSERFCTACGLRQPGEADS